MTRTHRWQCLTRLKGADKPENGGFSDQVWLMARMVGDTAQYAPLIVRSFRLSAPRKIVEAQRFNLRYLRYEDVKTVPERLKWCRYHLGLDRQEVADCVGIRRSTYRDMESGDCQRFPLDKLDALAKLYGVPVDDLIDGYNQFLLNGPGKAILEYRTSLGLGRKDFAKKLGTVECLVRKWEEETGQVSKLAWEKYFRDRL